MKDSGCGNTSGSGSTSPESEKQKVKVPRLFLCGTTLEFAGIGRKGSSESLFGALHTS